MNMTIGSVLGTTGLEAPYICQQSLERPAGVFITITVDISFITAKEAGCKIYRGAPKVSQITG